MRALYFLKNREGHGLVVAARNSKQARQMSGEGNWEVLAVISPACELSAEQFATRIEHALGIIGRLSPEFAKTYRAAVFVAAFDRFILRNGRVFKNSWKRRIKLRLFGLMPNRQGA